MSTIIPHQTSELVLIESRTMRERTIARTDALDKVKELALLKDGVHATTDLVAGYYDVDVKTIDSLVARNRAELEAHGMRKLTGDELRAYKQATDPQGEGLSARSKSLRLFNRKAILNVGQLLTESDVARQVRSYLLELEEQASPAARTEASERAVLGEARMRVLKAAEGIVDAEWLAMKARLVVAKAFDEEPEVDPAERPLYVPDFLKAKGLKKKQVESVQSWFGRRVASLYEAEHGEKPSKRLEDTSRGSVRETAAWVERDRPLFEEAWQRWYAAQYATPTQDEFPF